MRRNITILLALLVAAPVTSPDQSAQAGKDKGKSRSKKKAKATKATQKAAMKAFESGDYAEAARLFEEILRLRESKSCRVPSAAAFLPTRPRTEIASLRLDVFRDRLNERLPISKADVEFTGLIVL